MYFTNFTNILSIMLRYNYPGYCTFLNNLKNKILYYVGRKYVPFITMLVCRLRVYVVDSTIFYAANTWYS